MLEVGAGFGYWTLTAHAALQQLWRRNDLSGERRNSLVDGQRDGRALPASWYSYTLVEIDYAKQQLIRDTLRLNGIAADRSAIWHAAFGDRDEADGVVQNGNPGW